MSTPTNYVETNFLINGNGRIAGTREPDPRPGPKFTIIRGATESVWAVRSDVTGSVARELDRLALGEPPPTLTRDAPKYADTYVAILRGTPDSGPAFNFPGTVVAMGCTTLVDDVSVLDRHFDGWSANELPGRWPIVATVQDGYAVSVCCSSRLTPTSAEAGVETAESHRGRGLATVVVAAWASRVRDTGRVPLYSTSWSNRGSLAVARKLGLIQYATWWSVL